MKYSVIIFLIITVAGSYCLLSGQCSLLRSDQQGYRIYKDNKYKKAAETFSDSMWKATALYKAGEFKEAAGIFAGFDTPEGAYNQGNSLLMQGKYQEAVVRYTRALELQPGWEAAKVNKAIAIGRAEMVKKEGGNMTDGKMGADEITFTKGKSPSDAGTEETDGGQELSEAAMREVWLRKVQTKPADFLRSKFTYQYQYSNKTQAEEK
ncbi:MAG: tetratricopeptide repeat protein [Thermodesulfobacteriota bacterium]